MLGDEVDEWSGIILAEGLDDPAVINEFAVYKARISTRDLPLDDGCATGRWHLYWVRCSTEAIDKVASHIRRGSYAHFWKGDRLRIVYADRQFEVSTDDRSTWQEAVAHGLAQGIPERELDFPTE